MTINAYQVSNILRNYREQLKFKRVAELRPQSQDGPVVDEVSISAEGRRQFIIKNTANQVVGKITKNSIDRDNTEAIKE